MKQYRCYIFDLDGTLMDTSEGIRKSISYTLEQLRFPPLSDFQMRKIIGPPIYESFRRYLNMSPELSLKATDLFREVYKETYIFDATLYPNIYECLDLMRKQGAITAVATNKPHDFTYTLLKYFSLLDRFDWVGGSGKKNAIQKKDLIGLCLNELQISPTDAVMIGDTDSDAISAAGCGVDFVAVTYGFGYSDGEQAGHDGAVSSVDSVIELMNLLKV